MADINFDDIPDSKKCYSIKIQSDKPTIIVWQAVVDGKLYTEEEPLHALDNDYSQIIKMAKISGQLLGFNDGTASLRNTEGVVEDWCKNNGYKMITTISGSDIKYTIKEASNG